MRMKVNNDYGDDDVSDYNHDDKKCFSQSTVPFSCVQFSLPHGTLQSFHVVQYCYQMAIYGNRQSRHITRQSYVLCNQQNIRLLIP